MGRRGEGGRRGCESPITRSKTVQRVGNKIRFPYQQGQQSLCKGRGVSGRGGGGEERREKGGEGGLWTEKGGHRLHPFATPGLYGAMNFAFIIRGSQFEMESLYNQILQPVYQASIELLHSALCYANRRLRWEFGGPSDRKQIC